MAVRSEESCRGYYDGWPIKEVKAIPYAEF